MLRKVFGDVTAAAAVLGADARSDVVYLTPWSDHIADVVSSVLPGTTLKPLPSISGLTPEFSTAYGAALGGGTNGDATLMPREYARRAGARRRRRVVVAATAFVAAFGFAVGSLDYYRTRTVNRLAAGIDVYREQAATVLDLQTEADALSREASRLADVEAQRPNPLLVLETITRLLPTDASVRVLRNSGDEWQLDGFAQDAARLIPVFEESPEFEGVRFRTATSRVRLGSQTYEDYSLVLRYVPAP
jgi:general secretion pathway protein L